MILNEKAPREGGLRRGLQSLPGGEMTMAARCSSDLAARRKIDAVVYEVRKEMANLEIGRQERRAVTRRMMTQEVLRRGITGR